MFTTYTRVTSALRDGHRMSTTTYLAATDSTKRPGISKLTSSTVNDHIRHLHLPVLFPTFYCPSSVPLHPVNRLEHFDEARQNHHILPQIGSAACRERVYQSV